MKLYQLAVSLGLIFLSIQSQAQSLLTAIPPSVTITQVELVDWVEDRLNLKFTFTVSNANAVDIDISAIRYEMKVNSVLVAKDYRDQVILLKANTDTNVTIPVAVDMLRLISAVPDAVLQNLLRYNLQGAVVVKDFPMHIPFERKGELPLL
jgi:LEA14-like dessication related protein